MLEFLAVVMGTESTSSDLSDEADLDLSTSETSGSGPPTGREKITRELKRARLMMVRVLDLAASSPRC